MIVIHSDFDLPVRRSTQHGVFRHHSCSQGLRAVAVGGATQVLSGAARLGSAGGSTRRLDSAARLCGSARLGGSVGDGGSALRLRAARLLRSAAGGPTRRRVAACRGGSAARHGGSVAPRGAAARRRGGAVAWWLVGAVARRRGGAARLARWRGGATRWRWRWSGGAAVRRLVVGARGPGRRAAAAGGSTTRGGEGGWGRVSRLSQQGEEKFRKRTNKHPDTLQKQTSGSVHRIWRYRCVVRKQ